jgi:hypothetical protein
VGGWGNVLFLGGDRGASVRYREKGERKVGLLALEKMGTVRSNLMFSKPTPWGDMGAGDGGGPEALAPLFIPYNQYEEGEEECYAHLEVYPVFILVAEMHPWNTQMSPPHMTATALDMCKATLIISWPQMDPP